jgi:drug/metabolite transporter (DMT)-like permease
MKTASRTSVVAAFAAIYVFWGGTFLAVRYAVADIPPLLTIGLRCAGGAAVLFVWLAMRGQLARASLAQWRTAAISGTLLFLGCHAVMASVEQRVSSGETALLCTAIPLWMVLIDSVNTRRVPPWPVILGLALGASGVALLSGVKGLPPGRVWDHAALIAGAFAWALGSLVARDGPRPSSAVQGTAMQLAVGAFVVLAASAISPERAQWATAHFTPRAALSLAFLILCGTTLAFASYTWLLRVTSPAAVGTYAFVNPVIALLLGWAVGDDRLGPRTLIAAALVVSAVVVTQLGSRLRDARSPTAEIEGGSGVSRAEGI